MYEGIYILQYNVYILLALEPCVFIKMEIALKRFLSQNQFPAENVFFSESFPQHVIPKTLKLVFGVSP